MGYLSIRSLGITTISIIVVSGLISIFSAWSTFRQSAESSAIWSWYEDVSSPRSRALSAIVTNMGYGGVIHQFKDFILRQDRKQVNNIQIQIGGTLSAIEQYETAAISDDEFKALGDIRDVLLKYLLGVKTANRMMSMDQELEEILDKTRVDDQPAIQGIKSLWAATASAKPGSENRITKANLISHLRLTMGYDGLIHHFKDYVLTSDPAALAHIETSGSEALEVIATYRTLEISDEEDLALNNITAAVNKYLSNTSEVTTFIADGYSPKRIDSQIAFDDKQAIEGISTLVAAASLEARDSQDQLTANLEWAHQLTSIALVIAIVSMIILAGLTAYVLIGRIVRPLRKIERDMTELADGNLDIDIYGTDNKDEIGDMAKAIEVFKRNSQEIQRLEEERHETERQNLEQRRADMDALAKSFEETVGSVVNTITHTVKGLEETATILDRTADTAIDQADAVTEAASKSSESVSIVASAAHELDASIRDIATKANQSREVSTEAISTSENAKTTMRALVDGANKINAIVDLINDIADQTNLLALNATIEASRAGDAGKGFAVVASEVKALAQQTAKATEEIAAQIGAVQNTSATAVTELDRVGAIIANIDELTAGIADVIEEQSKVTNEISQSINNASSVTDEVTQGMEAVRGASKDTEDAATRMNDATQVLDNESETLNERIKDFLNKIRAA